ncbi:hypothetical protein XELAEV_18005887mg [Xenopus laevis]|uniref:Uncharacterized protein n=1 Tax=Xenopus laevis TaxID=8355 RepID=A0A974E039_XENLA|nr:hypothetical protein XELAEV_18005887mg [Xenopus laevis]
MATLVIEQHLEGVRLHIPVLQYETCNWFLMLIDVNTGCKNRLTSCTRKGKTEHTSQEQYKEYVVCEC